MIRGVDLARMLQQEPKVHAKVYIWSPTEGQVGHSSMSLSDGTYISFWPYANVSKDNLVCAPKLTESVEEDVSSESNRIPNIYTVEILDCKENNIKEFWNRQKTTMYNLISNNCATIIFLALKLAFPFLSVFDGKIIAWVPDAIGMVASYLEEGSQPFTEKEVDEITKIAKDEAERLAHNAGKISGKKVSKYFNCQII